MGWINPFARFTLTASAGLIALLLVTAVGDSATASTSQEPSFQDPDILNDLSQNIASIDLSIAQDALRLPAKELITTEIEAQKIPLAWSAVKDRFGGAIDVRSSTDSASIKQAKQIKPEAARHWISFVLRNLSDSPLHRAIIIQPQHSFWSMAPQSKQPISGIRASGLQFWAPKRQNQAIVVPIQLDPKSSGVMAFSITTDKLPTISMWSTGSWQSNTNTSTVLLGMSAGIAFAIMGLLAWLRLNHPNPRLTTLIALGLTLVITFTLYGLQEVISQDDPAAGANDTSLRDIVLAFAIGSTTYALLHERDWLSRAKHVLEYAYIAIAFGFAMAGILTYFQSPGINIASRVTLVSVCALAVVASVYRAAGDWRMNRYNFSVEISVLWAIVAVNLLLNSEFGADYSPSTRQIPGSMLLAFYLVVAFRSFVMPTKEQADKQEIEQITPKPAEPVIKPTNRSQPWASRLEDLERKKRSTNGSPQNGIRNLDIDRALAEALTNSMLWSDDGNQVSLSHSMAHRLGFTQTKIARTLWISRFSQANWQSYSKMFEEVTRPASPNLSAVKSLHRTFYLTDSHGSEIQFEFIGIYHEVPILSESSKHNAPETATSKRRKKQGSITSGTSKTGNHCTSIHGIVREITEAGGFFSKNITTTALTNLIDEFLDVLNQGKILRASRPLYEPLTNRQIGQRFTLSLTLESGATLDHQAILALSHLTLCQNEISWKALQSAQRTSEPTAKALQSAQQSAKATDTEGSPSPKEMLALVSLPPGFALGSVTALQSMSHKPLLEVDEADLLQYPSYYEPALGELNKAGFRICLSNAGIEGAKRIASGAISIEAIGLSSDMIVTYGHTKSGQQILSSIINLYKSLGLSIFLTTQPLSELQERSEISP